MLSDKEKLQQWGENARNYVMDNAGATEKILETIKF
jgi:hypothetical protein